MLSNVCTLKSVQRQLKGDRGAKFWHSGNYRPEPQPCLFFREIEEGWGTQRAALPTDGRSAAHARFRMLGGSYQSSLLAVPGRSTVQGLSYEFVA